MTLFCRHHEQVPSPAQAKSVIQEMFEEKEQRSKTVRNVSKPLTHIYRACLAYTWLCVEMGQGSLSQHADCADNDRCTKNPFHRSGKGCSCPLTGLFMPADNSASLLFV